MTRRLAIMNLSNWQDEDYIVSTLEVDPETGGVVWDEIATLAPGEHCNAPYEASKPVTIRAVPVNNPSKESVYADPRIEVVVPNT